jgi:hypothetical protein
MMLGDWICTTLDDTNMYDEQADPVTHAARTVPPV